jgi:two-component system, LuxR family, sensor kinase FixL
VNSWVRAGKGLAGVVICSMTLLAVAPPLPAATNSPFGRALAPRSFARDRAPFGAAIAAVCVLESVLIALLLWQRRRSRSVQQSMEDRFRVIADSAPVLIWMAGVDKLCTFFNKPWLDFTGRTLEQEIGNGWASGVHPADIQQCLKAYVEAFDARQPFVLQYRLRRHDGEYRWVRDHGVPLYDDRGGFAGYIGSCVDLTDRERAEQNFRLAVETSPNAIALVNEQGRIALVNPLMEELFGYPRGELIGQLDEILLSERFHEQHRLQRTEFFANPQTRKMGAGGDLFARRKGGTEFEAEMGLHPIHADEGILMLTVIMDISARKRAEREAHLLRQELARVNRVSSMGELASSLAHELDQPLLAISGNAEAALTFLKADPLRIDEVRDILRDIVSEHRRADEIIQRMRHMLKKGEAQVEPFDINVAVEEVLAMIRSDLIVRNVSVSFVPAQRLPLARGDRIQIQQVLLNLIFNGCDAMAGMGREKRVAIETDTVMSLVQVSVADNGTGIPPEQREKAFEPFYTTRAKGIGMGLPICRSIIKAHGGKIWASDNHGHGAVFRFTLPVYTELKG